MSSCMARCDKQGEWSLPQNVQWLDWDERPSGHGTVKTSSTGSRAAFEGSLLPKYSLRELWDPSHTVTKEND